MTWCSIHSNKEMGGYTSEVLSGSPGDRPAITHYLDGQGPFVQCGCSSISLKFLHKDSFLGQRKVFYHVISILRAFCESRPWCLSRRLKLSLPKNQFHLADGVGFIRKMSNLKKYSFESDVFYRKGPRLMLPIFTCHPNCLRSGF